MSMTINLLPWREAQRVRRTRKFHFFVIAMLAIGAGLGFLMTQFYQHKLEAQQQRNTYINDQLLGLNVDIEGVTQYQNDAVRLGEQLVVFQALQSERLQTIQLFNDVTESVANGVVYQRLSKTDSSVSATAVAASDRQVSEQLRRLAALPGLGVPLLSAVESEPQGSGRVFRFSVEQLNSAQRSLEEARLSEDGLEESGLDIPSSDIPSSDMPGSEGYSPEQATIDLPFGDQAAEGFQALDSLQELESLDSLRELNSTQEPAQ